MNQHIMDQLKQNEVLRSKAWQRMQQISQAYKECTCPEDKAKLSAEFIVWENHYNRLRDRYAYMMRQNTENPVMVSIYG